MAKNLRSILCKADSYWHHKLQRKFVDRKGHGKDWRPDRFCCVFFWDLLWAAPLGTHVRMFKISTFRIFCCCRFQPIVGLLQRNLSPTVFFNENNLGYAKTSLKQNVPLVPCDSAQPKLQCIIVEFAIQFRNSNKLSNKNAHTSVDYIFVNKYCGQLNTIAHEYNLIAF